MASVRDALGSVLGVVVSTAKVAETTVSSLNTLAEGGEYLAEAAKATCKEVHDDTLFNCEQNQRKREAAMLALEKELMDMDLSED